MKKIVAKWILISLGVGLIPVIILGASPGGIALSPLILLFSLMIGLVGSSIHVNIYAFTKGNTKQKGVASTFGCIALSLVAFTMYSESQCSLDQDYAIQRVKGYISKKSELQVQFLGKPTYDVEQCICSIPYSSESDNFTFIVSEYGKLHFARN